MHSLQRGRRCTPLYLVPTKDCPAPKIEAEIPNRTRHNPNCRPKTLQGRPTIIILQIDIYEAIYKMFLRQTTFAIAWVGVWNSEACTNIAQIAVDYRSWFHPGMDQGLWTMDYGLWTLGPCCIGIAVGQKMSWISFGKGRVRRRIRKTVDFYPARPHKCLLILLNN